MLKKLQSVSMVLFLGTLFSGTISTATASGANSFATTQQAGICKGLVKDATGESVIGASVVVKGTTNGTITDFDGNFSLDGIKKGDVIVISYVGYQTQEIKWNGSPLNVILKEDSKTLSEVVVVGYGTQKKANLSGSVAMVDSKELENRPIQNVSSGLQGLMPGVAITGTNGAPGQDAGKIRVRGIGTLNEAGPYILVDGIETGTLSAVDPNDIESISVLKDAASAAIYGSKAANGVVLITTKRGKTGQTKISYSGYLSFQNATNMIERMGSYEYASLLNQALEAEGMSKRFNDTELQKFKDGNDPLYPDTDWYDLAYKTGVQHRHNVNINGGSENVKYMASLGYLNQTGILPNAGREQFNARTNLDMKINKRLSARMNLSFIKNDYSDASSAYYGGSSDQIIRQLNLIAPWIVARYDDGTWGTISDGSPIAWLDSGMKVNRDNYNFSGMAAVDYEITTVGNVVSGSARAKETLEWLSSDIFGKVVQIKKGVTIDRDKTSINLNENMDSLVPASKISDMPTGWICGQTARDFIQTKTGIGGSMNVQESEEFKTSKFFCKTDFDMKEIKKEEAAYVPLPKFYTFKSREERERILYRNFVNVGIEVKEMIKDVLNKRGAK